MPRPARSPARGHTLLLTALVALVAPADGAEAGGFVVSGHTAGLYGGDELDELFGSLASIAYVLLVAGDDEDDDLLCGDDWRHHRRHPDGLGCDDLGIWVPQVQLSAGLGYTLTPRLTVGARYLYRYDRRSNDIEQLWGGGPEVTLDLRGRGAVRPFAGGYLLFTRGRRRADGLALTHGTSVGLRFGVRTRMAEGVSFVLHTGLQDDRFPYAPFAGGEPGIEGLAATSRGVTVGMGLRIAIE